MEDDVAGGFAFPPDFDVFFHLGALRQELCTVELASADEVIVSDVLLENLHVDFLAFFVHHAVPVLIRLSSPVGSVAFLLAYGTLPGLAMGLEPNIWVHFTEGFSIMIKFALNWLDSKNASDWHYLLNYDP